MNHHRNKDLKNRLPMDRIGILAMVACCLLAWGIPSAHATANNTDLTELSIEALMSMEITTTATRKEQRLTDTAAAVFVITAEDIRRSGATSIPAALRMVPGLQVARIDANKWAVSARGFNGFLANKLLVLMDGRSLYSPLYSGVFWHAHDTLLEDIARIEVIRGPGASLWGANAVNGVINIITKPAAETRGGLVSGGTGTEEKLFGALRYGGAIGEAAHYRVYGKYFQRDDGGEVHDESTNDQWDMARTGGRIDWRLSERDAFTVQGDYYDADIGNKSYFYASSPPYLFPLEKEMPASGGNVVTRWQRVLSPASDLILQTYYDRTEIEFNVLNETRDTWDLDFQHRFAVGGRQEVLWGFGYRLTRSRLDDSESISFRDDDRSDELISFFVQDEVTLWPDRLSLLVGSKFEDNDYTGWEVQPNLRLLWTPAREHTFWGAVSRAVRTPCQAEEDARLLQRIIPGPPDTLVLMFASEHFDSEKLLAYETGYRYHPAEPFSLDLALFYNTYEDLRTIERGSPYFTGTHVVQPFYAGNNMEADTYGLEVAVEYNPIRWWRLKGAYTYLEMDLTPDTGSLDATSEAAEEESPQHQVSLRSQMDLFSDWELDLWLRYVDELPAQDIDSVFTLDVRLGWRPVPGLMLSLVGQNLLDAPHREFGPELIDFSPTRVERSVYGRFEWRF